MPRNNIRYSLICEFCKKDFVAMRKDAKTCGDRCRQQRKRKSDHPIDWLLYKEHWLYKMYNSERTLLYVGVTSNAWVRLEGHMKEKKSWTDNISSITWQRYPDKPSALEAETKSIVTELPVYNIRVKG